MKNIQGSNTDKRLQSYLTLAVSAVGVGALPISADAEVIYTKLTPEAQSGAGGVINFDFLVNSTPVTFSFQDIAAYGFSSVALFGPGTAGAGFVGTPTEDVGGFPVTFVSNVAAGTLIGSTSQIQFFAENIPPVPYGNLTLDVPPKQGPFFETGPGYIGLTFQAEGNTYYGWARVEVNYDNPLGPITLYEYAYENTPTESIEAGAVPEPTTLGLLAAGAVGLSALRRSRRKTATALS